jgi:hypothetical protein
MFQIELKIDFCTILSPIGEESVAIHIIFDYCAQTNDDSEKKRKEEMI